MDWDRYKRLCDQPDTFSRWMLDQTSELLPQALQADLSLALAARPLAKPEDHLGDRLTDMFQLTLDVARVQVIHEQVQRAVSAGETTSGTRTRGLGGFEEAWREYLEALAARPGTSAGSGRVL